MNFSRSAIFHIKTIVCLEYFVNNCNTKKNLKGDVAIEIKQQLTQQLYAHSTTNLVKYLYGKVEILKSKVFWQDEPIGKK